MKIGRNDPCPCGSGKKYKRCCIGAAAKQLAGFADDMAQAAALSPEPSIDDLNLVAQRRAEERNNRPLDDFCGLSPAQIYNWMYAPLHQLEQVKITPPDDLTASPVMRYLSLLLDEALQHDGSFNATAKGNLPAKLVKQAGELLPEFAVAEVESTLSINEFSGHNEDRFNALHYTRVLADLAGIIKLEGKRFHVNSNHLSRYQDDGISALFLPMLEAAVGDYNWAYLDGWEDDIDLRSFWVFMLWRLQTHASAEQLVAEMQTAFPVLLEQLSGDAYFSPDALLGNLIVSRFIKRFLEFWGFVTLDSRVYSNGSHTPLTVGIQPLLRQCFTFQI